MPEFHETRMGVRFFESDFPRLVDQVKRLADALVNPPSKPEPAEKPFVEMVYVVYETKDAMNMSVYATIDAVREHLLYEADGGDALNMDDRKRLKEWDGKHLEHFGIWSVQPETVQL